MNDLERRRRRLRRAYYAIRLELIIAFAAPVLAGFMLIAAPSGFSPMFAEPPLVSRVVPLAGIAGVIIGLAWMVRLARANPEPDQHRWRYRDR